jgi:sugar phosphate isomerase/epimerase
VVFAGLNPIDLFNKYPGRFTMWHVKDMESGQNGGKGQSCEVGKGVINWKEIYAARKTSGLEIPYVEQEAYRHPVFECIKTSADYLKANKLI